MWTNVFTVLLGIYYSGYLISQQRNKHNTFDNLRVTFHFAEFHFAEFQLSSNFNSFRDIVRVRVGVRVRDRG